MGLMSWIRKGVSASDWGAFFKNQLRHTEGEVTPLSDAEVAEMLRVNAIVQACVTTKARAFAKAALTLQRRNREVGEWEPVEDAAGLVAPFTMNPWLSEGEIKQYLSMHLDMYGEAFVWKWPNVGKTQVNEVWPVPPTWVTIVPVRALQQGSEERAISHYIIKPDDGSGRSWNVQREEMSYTRLIDPLSMVKGLSPIRAASGAIRNDALGASFQNDSLKAMNLPGLVITAEKRLNDTERAGVRESLAEKLGDSAKANSLILGGAHGIKVESLNPGASFNWEQFSGMNESRICMSFGVPPLCIGALVGLQNTSGFSASQAQEANRWLYANTISPLWDTVGTAWTRDFVPKAMRENFRLAFDDSMVPEMQKDEAQLEERARGNFQAGLITLNEARTLAGWKAVDHGDVYRASMSDTLGTLEDLQAANSMGLAPLPPEDEL